MTVEEELSWEDRTADELQAIVRRGVQAGDMFFGASAEMERRSKETEAARDAQHVEDVRTFRRLRWEVWALLALAIATVVLLAVR